MTTELPTYRTPAQRAPDGEDGPSARPSIWCVLGTRPELIKLAPVVWELRRHAAECQVTVCLTGQHKDMVAPLVETFDLRPDFDLGIMKPNQRPTEVLASIIEKLGRLWQSEIPNWVVVHGDTTTTLAAALAGTYAKARVAHVEAGLRTGDRHQPFPEEINRRLVSQVADLHFAPTRLALRNLLQEGVSPASIEVTGNTVVDALHWAKEQPLPMNGAYAGLQARLDPAKKLVLLTCHRRENLGAPLREVLAAVASLAKRHRNRIQFVFPVHPNPAVQCAVKENLAGIANIHLIEPQPYLEMVQLLKRCWLVLTDSGGLQEEAPTFGVPVLVLRAKTERPEAVESGVAQLVGTNAAVIEARVDALLEDARLHASMQQAVSPFGDGRASQRIAKRLLLEAGGTETVSAQVATPSSDDHPVRSMDQT